MVGDSGYTHVAFRVIDKVSDTECLVHKDAQVMLLRGLSMAKVTDGVRFVLQHPVVIRDTYSYTTVRGGKSTVLVLTVEPRNAEDDAVVESPYLHFSPASVDITNQLSAGKDWMTQDQVRALVAKYDGKPVSLTGTYSVTLKTVALKPTGWLGFFSRTKGWSPTSIQIDGPAYGLDPVYEALRKLNEKTVHDTGTLTLRGEALWLKTDAAAEVPKMEKATASVEVPKGQDETTRTGVPRPKTEEKVERPKAEDRAAESPNQEDNAIAAAKKPPGGSFWVYVVCVVAGLLRCVLLLSSSSCSTVVPVTVSSVPTPRLLSCIRETQPRANKQ